MEYDGERPELGRLAGSNSIGPGARAQGCTEIGQKVGQGPDRWAGFWGEGRRGVKGTQGGLSIYVCRDGVFRQK